MKRLRFPRCMAGAALALLIGGCAAGGDVRKPIPAATHAATQAAHRLVVVLPGRGDDLASLERRRVAQTIQAAWPDADVILTGLTMPFYRQGQASKRLHDEIIGPAQGPGNRELWIVGISLGGMGAMLYEREYPGQADGILLLSPYLGDNAIHDEIRAAGSLARWNPGPLQAVNAGTFQHELWRTAKTWQQTPTRAAAVWLGYGSDEPFRTPIELLSPALPADHVVMLPGRHDWKLWNATLQEMLKRIRMERDAIGEPRSRIN
ncbi:MAG: alpha/beta hydrolase-fold protein [Dokdonella sp.]|uniref:alpha/beta hydrolase-fold protein n=1 Tax=Dokdonella sp. TaxID=2291710 RepID=UPI002CE8DC16|nr:alpha/beta hydrolase-fold protein [Dokdonella sp.]